MLNATMLKRLKVTFFMIWYKMCNKYTLITFITLKNHNNKKIKIMRSIIKALFFDKELVNTIKEAHIQKDHLYNLLFAGKITIKEYLNSGA